MEKAKIIKNGNLNIDNINVPGKKKKAGNGIELPPPNAIPNNKIKGLPAGFVKMKLCLFFSPKEVKVFEEHVLRMLVRDYHIYYSLNSYTDMLHELGFYCRPNDEISITYRLGCYCQCMLSFHTIEDIFKSDHILPQGFPSCARLEITEQSLK